MYYRKVIWNNENIILVMWQYKVHFFFFFVYQLCSSSYCVKYVKLGWNYPADHCILNDVAPAIPENVTYGHRSCSNKTIVKIQTYPAWSIENWLSGIGAGYYWSVFLLLLCVRWLADTMTDKRDVMAACQWLKWYCLVFVWLLLLVVLLFYLLYYRY